MDRRLRRAPDAEWVLMYRSGLSRARIAALVRAEPADDRLPPGHRPPPGPGARGCPPGRRRRRTGSPGPSPADLIRMDEVIAWVTAEGRFPQTKATDAARTVPRRGGFPAAGAKQPTDTLHPAYRTGLARVPGWAGNRRAAADEARWHDRLAQLVAFRAEGHDWPRHHDYASEREHALGVWIHTQRSTHRAGDLDPVKLTLLDEAVPGWQTGRRRGRPARQ